MGPGKIKQVSPALKFLPAKTITLITRVIVTLRIDEIKDDLRKDEGLSLKVYQCPAGKRTIGYGWNIDANPLPKFIEFYLAQHGEITLEMAEYLLDLSLSIAIESAKKCIPTKTWKALSLNQRAVVVEMIFNMGVGTFLTFKRFRQALNEGKLGDAVAELIDSDWYRGVTNARARKLIKKFMTEG